MSRKKPLSEKKESSKATIIIAIIGLIGTIVTAYFGYLSNKKPTEAISTEAISTETIPNSPVTFIPIPQKELLVRGFKLDGPGERVDLRFIAQNFDLDFNFSAPLKMRCDLFKSSIVDYFEFSDYMQINYVNDPIRGQRLGSFPTLELAVNGKKVVSCGEQLLQNMGLADGDLISLKIVWANTLDVTGP